MTPNSFEALPLATPIQTALKQAGYTTPSPIQAEAIPSLLEGTDLLGCAQTGTGKTAAFALPILNHILQDSDQPSPKAVHHLILAPTRELAVQIADSILKYGKDVDFSLGLVHGGVSQRPQVKALLEGLDILVATPGRLLDLMDQGFVDLSRVDSFVLDEADRMLDMGFINDIRKIAQELPEDRQSIMFSATMAPAIKKLADSLLNVPVEIHIAPEHKTAEKVDHCIRFIDPKDKEASLRNLLSSQLESKERNLSLVFCRTKHGARKLALKLNRKGIASDSIHGNKTQVARQKTLERFRKGKIDVLVATDVAARGIDVKNITLVVNYDLPMEPENYIHRIGRTARAGEQGKAVSLCSSNEIKLLKFIEKDLNTPVRVDPDHEHHDALAAKRASGEGPSFRSSHSRTTSGRKKAFVPFHKRGKSSGREDFRKRGKRNRRTAA